MRVTFSGLLCFLGWFAERVTAEKLRPLQSRGYFVFHDVTSGAGQGGKTAERSTTESKV